MGLFRNIRDLEVGLFIITREMEMVPFINILVRNAPPKYFGYRTWGCS